MSNKYKSHLDKSVGEQFEDFIESSVIGKTKQSYTWIRSNPKTSSLIAAGVMGAWVTGQFIIPWMVNKYHESKAQTDIENAEQEVQNIATAQHQGFQDLNANRFIIVDEKEKSLEATLAAVGVKVTEFNSQIAEAKEKFVSGNFKAVRCVLENGYSEECPNQGLISIIQAEIPPLKEVSLYATTLRQKRDRALNQENALQHELKPTNSGFQDFHLQTNPGSRLKSQETTLTYCIKIAIRPGVSDHARNIFESARTAFTTAHTLFASKTFTHYSTALDNTFYPANYDFTLDQQASIFTSIKTGDSRLAELQQYRQVLDTQWYTIITKRWESSHQETYYVTIANPSFHEWTEQECHQICTPKYRSDTQCQYRANANGTQDERCVTVQVPDGESCRNDCNPVTKDNGQPRTIEDERHRTVPEFWVQTTKYTPQGQTSTALDLKEEYRYREPAMQQGFQVWKPKGDDREYQGIGGIGPNREKPYLVP